jgi:hypothetical protein
MSENDAPSPARKPLSHPPYVLALVIADGIHHDPGTGKQTILGLFSAIHTTKFPVVLEQMAVYLAVTDGNGRVPLELRLVDVDDEHDALIEMKTEIEFPDPRMIIEANLIAKNVTFPKSGEYRLQLYGCGDLLIERRIVVVEHPSQTEMFPEEDQDDQR